MLDQLRSRHSPFIEWDAIEQGEIHYVAAWIAHRRGFVIEEPAHLSRAEAAFSELLAGLPKRRWLVSHFKRRLRDEAHAGLERAAAARRDNYREQWLLV